MKRRPITIRSRDYWVKVVEMMQQNWALIEEDAASARCEVYFIHDGSGVFDSIRFESVIEAWRALARNGFDRYADDKEAQKYVKPPRPPFYYDEHINGPIYSSGRFWLR